MADDKGQIVSCPTCQKENRYHIDNPFRPFCSERCRLIDLGEWADEETPNTRSSHSTRL